MLTRQSEIHQNAEPSKGTTIAIMSWKGKNIDDWV